eukprot:scaffold657_cov245-Pinguiococcus_pyrenoidosus.AAC.2
MAVGGLLDLGLESGVEEVPRTSIGLQSVSAGPPSFRIRTSKTRTENSSSSMSEVVRPAAATGGVAGSLSKGTRLFISRPEQPRKSAFVENHVLCHGRRSAAQRRYRRLEAPEGRLESLGGDSGGVPRAAPHLAVADRQLSRCTPSAWPGTGRRQVHRRPSRKGGCCRRCWPKPAKRDRSGHLTRQSRSRPPWVSAGRLPGRPAVASAEPPAEAPERQSQNHQQPAALRGLRSRSRQRAAAVRATAPPTGRRTRASAMAIAPPGRQSQSHPRPSALPGLQSQSHQARAAAAAAASATAPPLGQRTRAWETAGAPPERQSQSRWKAAAPPELRTPESAMAPLAQEPQSRSRWSLAAPQALQSRRSLRLAAFPGRQSRSPPWPAAPPPRSAAAARARS